MIWQTLAADIYPSEVETYHFWLNMTYPRAICSLRLFLRYFQVEGAVTAPRPLFPNA